MAKESYSRGIPYTLPNGFKTELFYIGVLAAALGRTQRTMRQWEIGRVIPKTPFKDKFGRRLYSREQIDAIVRCAERAGIMPGRSIAHTSFSRWVYAEFIKITKLYGGTQDG